MGFDIYKLIHSEEVREHLRKCHKFTLLDQEMIIRNSFYPVECKLTYMNELLNEAEKEVGDKREISIFEEKVALYEFIVDFIYRPNKRVIYMAKEEICGYNVYDKNNHYRLSERIFSDTYYFGSYEELRKYWEKDTKSEYTVCVDMVILGGIERDYSEDVLIKPIQFNMRIGKGGKLSIISFKINESWFIKQGFSQGSVYNKDNDFRVSLPFENGDRVKLQTLDMRKPVFGIMNVYKDVEGRSNYLLWVEDEKHDYIALKKMLAEGTLDYRDVDVIDLSYLILNICSGFLSYDWVERC